MLPEKRWFPEEIGEGGAPIGELFLKLLTQGTNELTEPELLVRETAQNSWDARRVDSKRETSMSFRVSALGEVHAVRDKLKTFFREAAAFDKNRLDKHEPIALRALWRSLSRTNTSLLYVRDEGTMGLGGPTSARVPVGDGVIARYVRFVLNIGHANEDESAGGSYGLGRSVFWRMSTCRTIIIYTRFLEEGAIRSRLIGSTIGAPFTLEVNYTGRHWWSNGENGRPFEDSLADEWAERLGFEMYEGDTTGTAVMVIAPNAPGGTRDLAKALAMSIEYHLWPKYVTLPGRAPAEMMIFEVRDGSVLVPPLDIPDLYRTPLASHVRAFELDRKNKDVSGEIYFSSQLTHEFRGELSNLYTIGRLSLLRMIPQLKESSPSILQSEIDPEDDPTELTSVLRARFANLANTVALMRAPELVVCYKKILKSDNTFVLSGVFKASKIANGFFRKCESATHSEWSPSVPADDAEGKLARRVASQFEKKFNAQIDTWFPKLIEEPISRSSTLDVGELSARFGKLINHIVSGRGNQRPDLSQPDKPGKSRGNIARGTSPKVSFRDLEVHEGQLVNVWDVSFVRSDPGKIQLEVLLRIDSNESETSAVTLGGRPSILRIEGHVGSEADPKSESVDETFRSGKDDESTVKHCLEYGRGKDDSEPFTGQLVVKSLFDEGTTPILAVSFVAPAAELDEIPTSPEVVNS